MGSWSVFGVCWDEKGFGGMRKWYGENEVVGMVWNEGKWYGTFVIGMFWALGWWSEWKLYEHWWYGKKKWLVWNGMERLKKAFGGHW